MLLCPPFCALCSIALTVCSLSNVSEREFCWGNVDLSHLEIAPWCFGFKGKDLNYSPHELQEHSALLFPTSNCQYFQVPSCRKLHSWVQYWKAALVLWFDNVIVKTPGERRKANSGPERCLKRCQVVEVQEEEVGTLTGNPRSPQGIRVLLSIWSLPEFLYLYNNVDFHRVMSYGFYF